MLFEWRGGVCDVLGEHRREMQAGEVEAFYTRSPFPGYAPEDDGPRLLDRSRRSDFLRALDESIPTNARVLDVGCGTGQLSAFLALAAPDRTVIGLDGCRASLALADEFRARSNVERLQFVRADLFDMPMAPRSFDVVISRGVCHHTPNPERAIEAIADRVQEGGGLVLGFYETAARFAHVLRRRLWNKTGKPRGQKPLLDPVLRRSDLTEEKRRIWIEDQYLHPLEHILPLPQVWKQLGELGFGGRSTVPPIERDLFAGASFSAAPDLVEPGAIRIALRRAAWVLQGWRDPDAGLVAIAAHRANAAEAERRGAVGISAGNSSSPGR